MKISTLLLSFALASITGAGFSQDKPVIPVVTADSLASGNYRDVLSSFFQVAVDHLTGPQKELSFNSNPYAIMLKADPSIGLDKRYLKYSGLRNVNFNFDAKLDSSYRFNGFASGIKYALINQRDVTISDRFIDLFVLKNREYHVLNDGIVQQGQGIADSDLRKRLRDQGHRLLTDSTFSFNQMDREVRDLILKIAADSSLSTFISLVNKDPNINIYKQIHDNYDEIKNSFQNKLLWTLGVSDTTYNHQFAFSNIVFSTELLKGIISPKAATNLELDLKASLNLSADTNTTGRNLRRNVFTFEPGVNWVLKSGNKNTPQSLLEFKLSGSFIHVFSDLYPNEKRDNLLFNGTLRIRIINDIWIPLEFKYDPHNGNFFGFLSVKANFSTLGSLLKSKK